MTVDIIFNDGAGNAAALVLDRYFMQVRMGALTEEALAAYHGSITAQLNRHPHVPLGSFHVVDGSAPTPPTEMRDRQRNYMGPVLARKDIFVSTVILGEGIQATAMRTIIRLLVLGNKRMHHASALEEGARWLADNVGVGDVAALLKAYGEVRGSLRPG